MVYTYLIKNNILIEISYFEHESILFNSFLNRHITPLLFFKHWYGFDIFLYNKIYGINNWLVKFDFLINTYIYNLLTCLFFILFLYVSLFYNNLNLIATILIIEIFFITLVMLLLTTAACWYNPTVICFALIILILSAVEFAVLLAVAA